MEYTYYPKGVCSNKIDIEVEGNIKERKILRGM